MEEEGVDWLLDLLQQVTFDHFVLSCSPLKKFTIFELRSSWNSSLFESEMSFKFQECSILSTFSRRTWRRWV